MRGRLSLLIAAAAASISIFGFAGSASAHDRMTRECNDKGVLSRIDAKFQYQIRHVPNLPDAMIGEFRRIHEHRYYPSTDNSPIARRYCGATLVMTDGKKRDVWYLIEDGMGLAGIGDNVEFCVSGYDRWKVYNGRCRVLW